MNYRDFFKELFALILRCIGLTMLYYGIPLLFHVIIMLINEEIFQSFSALSGATFCLVGAWLIRGAPGLLSYCYPKDRKKES
jgi:hypothetical protein